MNNYKNSLKSAFSDSLKNDSTNRKNKAPMVDNVTNIQIIKNIIITKI